MASLDTETVTDRLSGFEQTAIVARGPQWTGSAALRALRGRRSLRITTAALALLFTIVVGRGLLEDASFPTTISFPLGDSLQAAIDAFAEHGEWMYSPLVSALTSTFDLAFELLWYTPAPTLAVFLIATVFLVSSTRLALLAAALLAWTIAVGMWETTVETIAFMLVAVACSCALGIAIGILASVNRRVDAVVRSVLDWMQAFPILAYFVPVVVIVGTGDAAALLVTVIWALPPVARMTVIGLRGVSADTVEAARSFGASSRQLLWRVKLPLAGPSIAAGVNQTIMFAISMATIAAMIGGSGLGQPVWEGLSRLDFGRALEGGVALVLLAVVLDRASARGSENNRRAIATYVGQQPGGGGLMGAFVRFMTTHRRLVVTATFAVVAATVVSTIPALRNMNFNTPPGWMEIDLRKPVSESVFWVTTNLGGMLDIVSAAIRSYILAPVTDTLRWIPWPAVLLAGFLAGLATLGLRGAILVAGGITLIGLIGMWDAAVVTVALVGVSALLALLIGIPLGVLMSRSDRAAALMRPVLDVIQTLPIFLFVIPAVLFLGSGAVAGTIATVCYALPPTIRLTNIALRNVDEEVVEAATSLSASRWRILRDVRVPLGLPTMLVGINQTVLLAMAMVVVAALVGTPGLGEELLIAIGSTNFGRGLEAGIAMFLLAVMFDRVFTAFTRRLSIGQHLKND